MRALALLSGATLSAAVVTACDGGVTEPPFLPETSPTPDVETTPTADPSAELESFRAFAALIEDAVATGDGSLIEDRALPSVEFWVGDTGGDQSPQRVRAAFERLVSEAMPQEADEFGSGEARLYALARRAEEPAYGESRYQAMVTAIVPKSYGTHAPYRSIAVYEFALRDGRWRLATVLTEFYSGEAAYPGEPVWLTGDCAECFHHWERWEGTP